MAKWTASDIPPQSGRSSVVTGTGGLGFETALALARAGSEVILAGRNPKKGAAAVADILAKAPAAKVRFEQLDLASLASIADFAARLRGERDRLDLLVNNAGVLMPPKRLETADGFELQLGTNYFGHFALTGQLMPLLREGRDARVVTVSSTAANRGAINFDDLNAQKSYNSSAGYNQSKLACLMFTFELQRRAEAAGWPVASIAAHPGVSRTNIMYNGPGRFSLIGVMASLLRFLFQPAAQGALPILYAATSPDAKGGAYYGPDKLSETRGYPTAAKIPPQALDADTAARLWELSERYTGVRF